MRGVMRGIAAMCVSVLVFAPSVSAAETVVTAQVAGVRHVLVDTRGNILQVISNTSEDVTPIVHVGSFDSEQVAMSDAMELRYRAIVAEANMQQAGVVYVRHSPLKALITHISRMSILPLSLSL